MIFHHHPDGILYLRDTARGDLMFTIAQWNEMASEPYVGLPAGCKERIFDMTTGRSVLFTDDNHQIDGGDFAAVVSAFLARHPDFTGSVQAAIQQDPSILVGDSVSQ